MKKIELEGRWSEYILEALPCDCGEIIASSVNDGFQGECSYLIRLATGNYALAEWSWGSCSYCDPYETLTDEEAKKELATCVSIMTPSEASEYVKNVLREYPDSWLRDAGALI